MEELLEAGRHNVVEILQDNISLPLKKRKLDSILRTILHPLKGFDNGTVRYCYWLLSYGQKSLDEYLKILKSFDTSTVCGLVWNANFFAYRCRDCGISPCMSLCADCFVAGNHEGHDFNMFKSQAGGACDCGDENVMKASGFCNQHGKVKCSKKTSIPEELVLVPKVLIPKLVNCLHEKLKNKQDTLEEDPSTDIENVVQVLNKICEVEVLREIFCEKILSPIEAFHESQQISSSAVEVTHLISCEASNGRKVIRSVSSEPTTIEMTVANTGSSSDGPYKPNEIEPLNVARGGMKEVFKKTYLQYLMEVLVKTEFPSELALFLLQLLPNQNYKEQFTRLFCRQYTAIGKSLSSSENPDRLSNHVVHVSVQLFSNEQLALRMVKEENLLFKMIFVLSKMVGECLDNYSLEIEGHETSIMAVNCDHKILKTHCNWPIASDLTNILSHQTVTKIFLETGDCLNRWMHFVNMLTGMNVNHLRLLTHVEYESKTYYTAFSIEFESVAAVMWEIYRSILKMNEKAYVLKMIEVSAAALKDWYSFVPITLKKPSFTFHLSLHRYFALFASLAINEFREDVTKLLPKPIAHSALSYLISTLAAVQEIRSGFWLYNGHQIKCQAQSYMQSDFCNSMLDLDVFFVQMSMVVLPPGVILDMLIDRFGIRGWFQFGEQEELFRNSDQSEKLLVSVEAFLNTLLMLLTHHVYTGISEEEAMRKDIIANLCVSDKTHSQLLDVVPTRPGDTQTPGKQFDQVLQKVANYKSPAVESFTMQQGMYALKDEVWEKEFDINHIKHRIYKKSDQQQACVNFNQFIQRKGLSKSARVWPPLRDLGPIHSTMHGMFRILESKMLHQILIFILHKTVQNEHSIPETLLISVIHLLELTFKHQPYSNTECTDNEDISFVKKYPVIDLTLSYMQHTGNQNKQSAILEKIYEEINKDAEMSQAFRESKLKEIVEIDGYEITYAMAELYHNILFKPMCSHLDTLIVQGSFSVPTTCKHLSNLITQLSDKHRLFLKHLLMYWNSICDRDGLYSEDLPFVKKKTDSRAFGTVISLLLENFNQIFQVYEPLVGFPFDAFQIELPRGKSLLENAECVVNNHGSVPTLIKQDAYYYTSLLQSSQQEQTETSNVHSMEYDVETTPTLTPTKHTSLTSPPSCTLLNLLVQLKGKLEETRSNSRSPRNADSREFHVGDGSYTVGELLKKFFSKHDDDCGKDEDALPGCSNSSPESSKQERRRKASEIQKGILAEFASKQKKVFNNIVMTMEGDDDDINKDDVFSDDADNYECIICGQKNESTENSPIGLIVLLQPSTVLGKRKTKLHKDQSNAAGPSHVADTGQSEASFATVTCEESVFKRREALAPYFDSRSIRSSFEIGLDYGINIQTCGHHIHVHCHILYFKSLKTGEQTRLLDLSKEEFSCPLCRQLSNGVLPILPSFLKNCKAKDLLTGNTFEERCSEINNCLTLYQQGGLTQFTARALEFTTLTASISNLAQRMEQLTRHSSRSVYNFHIADDWKWTDKYFLLLASLRQNVESQLYSGQEVTTRSKKAKSCLREVFEIFQFHAQYVSSPLRLRWSELCYGADELCESTVAGRAKSSLTYNDVPILLVESQTLLLQFVLTWPQKLNKGELLHIIQLCYNLTFVQALIMVGSSLVKSERLGWIAQANKNLHETTMDLTTYAGIVWKHFPYDSCQVDDDHNMIDQQMFTHSVVSPHVIETKIREYCLPFLRFASFIIQTWQNVTTNSNISEEVSTCFGDLVRDLNLNQLLESDSNGASASTEISSTNCLLWSRDNAYHVIKHWCKLNEQNVSGKRLFFDHGRNLIETIPSQISWDKPTLIPLPRFYDSLFQEYRKRKCARCNTIPHDPTLCLVCGGFLCFHSNCCLNEEERNECVQHSIDCGCGTGIFLVISSSVTLIIRESRVTLWGSVYLDSFGEEDKDLRRGKPLFLSDERYKRLEEEWQSHILDRSSRRWGVHQNRV